MANTKEQAGTVRLLVFIGFLVPFLLAVIGYIVIQVWPFGDGTVLIIDSIHQYLPFYTEFHEKLVSGESLFYDFSGGMGYDFWATIAYYLASPLNLIMVLVPTPNVADFMDYIIAFKIGMSGAIFCWYLHKRDTRRFFLPVVFGTMFAMGNFMIGYYFNLMWLDSIAVLPLIMAGIERLTSGKGGRLFGFSLFYALWCNYYIGFMLCLFSCLYFIVCTVSQPTYDIKKIFGRGLKFAAYGILAAMGAAVILLPAFLSLLSSEAMQSNHFPQTVKFYADFADLIAAHFAQVHPINISDNQVGLNAYCGTAVLILVPLYALDERISLREKIGKLALAGILLLSFSLNILNYIWHGFHTQNGLPNRFAFIYVCLVLVMSYDALRNIKRMSVSNIVLCTFAAAAFSLVLIAEGKAEQDVYGGWVYLTPVLLAVYGVLLTYLSRAALRRNLCIGIAGGFLLAEACAHGIYGYIYNENVTRSIYLEDQASFKKLVPEAEKDDFFRSEIDSQRMRNVSMYAGANSIIMFNSTMRSSVTEFCDRIGMEARTNKNGYNGVTTLVNDLLGVRYVLSSNGKGDRLYQFEKIGADDNLTLYYNDEALPVGYMVSEKIREWDTTDGNPLEVQDSFVRLALGEERLYTYDRTITLKDQETVDIKVPQGKQVYLYLPARVKRLELNTPEYNKTYTTYTDHVYSIHSLGDEDLASVKAGIDSGKGDAQGYVYTCRDEDVSRIAGTLAQHSMKDAVVRGNRLEGEIDAGEGGMLLLTVPYDKNWKVTVDGENAEAEMIGGALTGIALEGGIHSVRMVYEPEGFKGGLLLSILGFAAMLAVAFSERRREKKEALLEDREELPMELKFSDRAMAFKPGIFAALNEKKEELQERGVKIFNLSVGTPDFEPSPAVRKAVSEAAKDPANYRYSLKDMPELVHALEDYYERRYGVILEDDEIMSIYGSQEGMAHIAWVLCNPGDLVLVPNPGYPIFKIGPELCGARTWEYPLKKENNFLPDFSAIPEEVLEEAKYMVVNYPGNPLTAAAPDSFYEELIAFAKRYQIIIVHDNAYSDILFGGREGKSFLSFEGAKEVGVEFYSLSKTFDYTGARMSFVVGNREIVEKFRTLRSQFDYGVFYPVQYGALAALSEEGDAVAAQCAAYEERMEALCGGLRSIGWDVQDSEGTMFVWAPLPEGYTDSAAFCMKLMEMSGVICTPGISFGSLGEGYVRFALVLPPEQLAEAVEAIRQSGILEEGRAKKEDKDGYSDSEKTL